MTPLKIDLTRQRLLMMSSRWRSKRYYSLVLIGGVNKNPNIKISLDE